MFGRPRTRTTLTIAVIALTLAMSGGAAAVAAPLTEKAVKKIAKTQVKKLAPKLSVAKAKNADALGGVPASSYLLKSGLRADGVAASADIPMTMGTFSSVLSKSIDAPTDGFVFVVGSLSVVKSGSAGSDTIIEYGINLDGTAVTTDVGFHSFVVPDEAPIGSGSITTVLPVSAGSHTVALMARDQGSGSQLRGRSLSLLFTPTGSAPVLPY